MIKFCFILHPEIVWKPGHVIQYNKTLHLSRWRPAEERYGVCCSVNNVSLNRTTLVRFEIYEYYRACYAERENIAKRIKILMRSNNVCHINERKRRRDVVRCTENCKRQNWTRCTMSVEM